MWKGIIIGVLAAVVGFFGARHVRDHYSAVVISPIGKIIEKPLDKYAIDALSTRSYVGSQIVLDEATATTSSYTVYRFHFVSDGKRVTGLAHIPSLDSGDQYIKQYPVIVQFRGYINRESYVPGAGTTHSAEVFARNGFISLAPDFLGYGDSDMPSRNVFEERFQTYTAALNLLASVKTLALADANKIGIWGHSNGGQIALTVSEIVHTAYPTVLWAPVSKPFPYSILYYTDDADDHGKLLRRELAKFEAEYDVEKYSLTNYLDRISSPLQIHQGGADEAVPQKWTDTLVDVLKEKKKDPVYYIYPNANHDMLGAWNTVVGRDIGFFQKYLLKQ